MTRLDGYRIIERFVLQPDSKMQKLQSKTDVSLRLALIFGLAFSSVVPVAGYDQSTGQSETGSCRGTCHLEESTHCCCCEPTSSQVCQCAVENETPVFPVEKRTSSERVSFRQISTVTPAAFEIPDCSAIVRPERLRLAESSTAIRLHAILCCWLT